MPARGARLTDIAVVVVDGKEQFFDPGTRYCPYGHLAWRHTFAEGIRRSLSWFDDHPDLERPDAVMNGEMDKILETWRRPGT